jgi:nicotinamidase-related amidase
VGWVVDAQIDFMDPGGRLYVKGLDDPSDPGAQQILPTLERAVAWMHEQCPVVVFTGDWHGLDDEEIDAEHPDPTAGTYPPHCMGRSADPDERRGAQIVESIRPRDSLVLEVGATDTEAAEVARRAVAECRPVFIHKNRFDVFAGNAATDAFLDALAGALGRALEFVVVGVARDVCVTQAVDGMRARGYPVTALSDATWGLGLEAEADTLTRWADGGRVTTLDALTGRGSGESMT